MLTKLSMLQLVHAFISSWIDYCNSVFTGISDQLLQRLQVIQNAAARLITRAIADINIWQWTLILRELHWPHLKRFDYGTTTTRLRRKIDMFIFCSRRMEEARTIRRSRIVVVSQSNRNCNHGFNCRYTARQRHYTKHMGRVAFR